MTIRRSLRPARRAHATHPPRHGLRGAIAVLVSLVLALGMLGLGTPRAYAAAAGDIAKQLDGTQDVGFTSPDTFLTGSLVRYRLTISCSSLDTHCVTATVRDVLDPHLTYVEVKAPVVQNNDHQTIPIVASSAGQTVTITVGSAAAPLQGGNTLEVVLVARVTGRPSDGKIPNQATISVPGAPDQPSKTVVINVPAPAPNYKVSKSVMSPSADAALGENVTYSVALLGYRVGNVDLVVPFTVTDTYPAGATVVDAGGGTVDTSNHTITWTVTSVNQINSPNAVCDYTDWCTPWKSTVKLRYDAPTFSGGQTVVNSVETDPTYTTGDLPPLTSSASKKLIVGTGAVTAGKGGSQTTVPGGPIQWKISATNSGSTTLTNVAVTDALPAGLTQVTMVRESYAMPVYPSSLGPVYFEAQVNGSWQLLSTYGTDGSWPNSVNSALAVPAGATAVRLRVDSLAPGNSFSIGLHGVVPKDAAVGTSVTNCAAVSTSSAGAVAGNDACAVTSIEAPSYGLTPYKGHVYTDDKTTSIVPGETFAWGLGVKATGAVPVKAVDIADVLPKEFEYVGVRCFSGYGDGSSSQASLVQVVKGLASIGPGCNKPGLPQPTVVHNADGTTSLSWQDVPLDPKVQTLKDWDYGTIWWLVLDVRVKPGTAVANYTNQMAVGGGDSTATGTTCNPKAAVAPLSPDATDWDADGNTTETLCRANDPVQVRLAAGADTTKWDKGPLPNALQTTGMPSSTCPDWDGFTRYPCVAQTNPGGDFEYRFNLQNTGNMTLTDHVSYDILPVGGDTGVSQVLSTQSRGTQWVPVLTGPLAIESQPADAHTSILYNLTSNPCRPEVAQGDTDAVWQATCDDTWYTAAQITDWSTVKSLKIVAFQNGAVWQPTEQIILRAPMHAPESAPDSTKTPLNLSIAWNSIAHREFKINADGSTARLLAAEPLKVGIIVPFAGVSVGDYVWLDSDRDGLQDPGEDPIAGVKVDLKDATGAVVQSTTTDARGYYSFQYLDAAKSYTVVFHAPDGMVFTKPNASGVTSNDPTADNGTKALDGTTGGDSDAIAADDGLTGSVTFTTPATGKNKVSDPVAGTVADNPGLDAGFVPKVVPVSVGDYVWWDTNRNGLHDAGEAPVPGVKVTLADAAGKTVGTTTTDDKGYYWFTDLNGGAKYTLTFTAPDGTTWTTKDASGVTDNNLTTDANDSDVNPADGTIAFTAPASGSNKPGAKATDNPTLDGGLVQYNLTLAKVLKTAGPFVPGQTVEFTLTPHNDGPSDAVKGWSVTDILPAGLTLVDMLGADYACDVATATCTASQALAAKADGAAITVTARLDAGFAGKAHNVAYVSPSKDDVAETNPLVVPTTTTDTSKTDTDNDAQADLEVKPVSVGDYVWWDTNRNGLQDADEDPVAGVIVTLKDAAGKTVGTATTDDQGYYWFTGLNGGQSYSLAFAAPAGATWTTQDVSGVVDNNVTTDKADSDVNPVDGTVAFTAPVSGSNQSGANATDNPTLDAGLVKYNLTLAKVLKTAGPFVPGQTVEFTLTPHNDGPSDAVKGWSVTDILPVGLTLTGMSGTGYACDVATATCTASQALAAKADGSAITVTATIGESFLGTAHNVAYVSPSKDDVAETNPLVVPTTTTDTSKTDTDNDAQADLEVKPVSVGDYVWWDTNRNGQQDSDEPPVPEVTVNLWRGDAQVASTKTDASGYFAFTDLYPNTAYTVEFVKPDGTSFTTAFTGATASDSNADVTTGKATVTTKSSGTNKATPTEADDPTIDAGLVKYNLTLAKVLKTAGPFVPGQSVEFTLTPHNDGPVAALAGWSVTDILPVGLTLTGMSGTGYACDVATATCTASEVLAAKADGSAITVTATIGESFLGTAHNVAYVSPSKDDVAETNPLVVPTTTTDTSKTDTDNDAQADLEVKPVSVGDYVWWDTNRNGQQDSDEPPVPEVTVNLWRGDIKVGSVTTDADGYYAFKDLLPGTQYRVDFVRPAGTSFTTQQAGNPVSDSNPDVTTGQAEVTTPTTGSNLIDPGKADDPTIDAGLVKYNLTLAKVLKTAGPFVPGQSVEFTLTPHNDGPSDAVKGWSVTDILPAGLTLVDMLGAGYACDVATATCTASEVLAAKADGSAITVTATIGESFLGTAHNVAYVSPSKDDVAETNPLVVPTTTTDTSKTDTDNDAQADLEVKPVSVGDYVWWDTNRNGLQDATESPVPAVKVNLYRKGELVASTTTDAAGYYAFAGLLPATDYTVEFVRPNGTTFTRHAADDATRDSNADLVSGKADVRTPATGSNLTEAGKADDPTIDAGLVSQINLVLAKTLDTRGPFKQGHQVTFTLTPANEGPMDALAGWSVTDVLPKGLTLVSLSGAGYTCDAASATCVAADPLAAGAKGAPILVTATLNEHAHGVVHNVAYVAPSPEDVAETNPLAIPTTATDTDASATDNDAQAQLTVAPVPVLPQTGGDVPLWAIVVAPILVLAGLVLVWAGRRRRDSRVG